MNLPAATQPNGPLLRDIHLPPQPSWWPLAPGWWALAVLLLAAIALTVWYVLRQRRRRIAERQVLAEVDRAVALWREQPQALAAGLHQLLRRGALGIDDQATQLRGDAWRRLLARLPVDASTLEQLHAVEVAMFQPGAPLDVERAAEATRRWLRLAWRQSRSGRVVRPRLTPSLSKVPS
jgi:hypothetical protein